MTKKFTLEEKSDYFLVLVVMFSLMKFLATKYLQDFQ